MTRRLFRWSVLLFALSPVLHGCASMQQQQVSATEDLLAAAGFKIRPADTPERMAHLNTLQPYKLIARSKDGEFVYTYADPLYCKCLYAGGPTSAPGELEAPGPGHIRFWSKPVSTFGLFWFTTLAAVHLGWPYHAPLVPDRPGAGSRDLGSRSDRHPCG